MTIAPIVQTVEVKAQPAHAFDLFAAHIGQWWPKGGGIGKAPCTDVIIEPRAGGRWFERDAEGAETQWGKVLAWEPPGRLLLAWQLTPDFAFDPNLVTEVEITFVPNGALGTRVTLEHRQLDRFGACAADLAAKLRGGWSTRVDGYATFANTKI